MLFRNVLVYLSFGCLCYTDANTFRCIFRLNLVMQLYFLSFIFRCLDTNANWCFFLHRRERVTKKSTTQRVGERCSHLFRHSLRCSFALTKIFARIIDQVLGPLISKSDSNGGDDGALVSATSTAGATTGGMNVGGLAVTPVLALGPNGTQQHILQVIDVNQTPHTSTMWLTGDGRKVTAAPMVTSQLLGEVDSSILASAMQQVTSGDVVDLQETSPSSNSD